MIGSSLLKLRRFPQERLVFNHGEIGGQMNAMKTTRLVFGLSLVFLFFNLTVIAQTGSTGALSGTVTDSQGANVSGVEVTVTNEATGEKRSATSQENGDYAVAQLLPGSYRVEFSKTGFKTAVKSG